jgi:hypothetical protein
MATKLPMPWCGRPGNRLLLYFYTEYARCFSESKWKLRYLMGQGTVWILFRKSGCLEDACA